MNTEELKNFVITELDNFKVKDIKVLHVTGRTSLADYIIIGTANSNRHVDSVADNLRSVLKEKLNIIPKKAEGKATGWILVDLNSILVNIFTEESRNEYKLEELWLEGVK